MKKIFSIKSIKAQALLIWGFIFFILLFFQFFSELLFGSDGYYHIRLAEIMGREGLVLHDFPWHRIGLWSHSFADKEFLFHVYLLPFTWLQNLQISFPGIGIKVLELADTGRIAIALLGSFVFLIFFLILKSQKIVLAPFWTLFLFSGSIYWIFRICMIRPHVMSILFFLTGIYFLFLRKWPYLFFLAFLYPIAYHSAFIFMSIPFFFLLLLFLKEKRDKQPPPTTKKRYFTYFYPLVLVLTALLLGYCFHPYFPKNIYLFYVQIVKVLSHMMMDSTDSIGQELGAELHPTPFLGQLQINMGVLLLWGVFLVLLPFYYRRLRWKTWFLLCITLPFSSLMVVSARFIEYWLPSSFLFFAFAFHDIFPAKQDESRENEKGKIIFFNQKITCFWFLLFTTLSFLGVYLVTQPFHYLTLMGIFVVSLLVLITFFSFFSILYQKIHYNPLRASLFYT
ncbi:MAG: hypothetical protein D6785_04915, partial [Planctomycetota bacterium]